MNQSMDLIHESPTSETSDMFEKLVSFLPPLQPAANLFDHTPSSSKGVGTAAVVAPGAVCTDSAPSQWGIWGASSPKTKKEPETDTHDVKNMLLCPSDAGVLKYLTYMKIASGGPEPVSHSSSTNNGSKRHKRRDKGKGSKRTKCDDMNRELEGTTPSGPSLLSFPVTIDSDSSVNKADDIYISTLKFRSYTQELIMKVCKYLYKLRVN